MSIASVYRPVQRWVRLKDCWEAELSCGHKNNTGPGTFDHAGPYSVNGLPWAFRCPTCEGVAEQVLQRFPVDG